MEEAQGVAEGAEEAGDGVVGEVGVEREGAEGLEEVPVEAGDGGAAVALGGGEEVDDEAEG